MAPPNKSGIVNPAPTAPEDAPDARLLQFTRVGVPVLITVVGVVMIVIGHGKTNSAVAVTGLCLIGVAVMVWMLNWMYRMSLESNAEREEEEQARDFFTAHGYWPGEQPK